MTVSSEVSRTDYLGNGAVATYATTFAVKATSELRVFVEDAGQDEELVLGADYSAVLAPTGLCSITLTAGNLANGLKLSLQRGIPYTQTVDPTASGAYSPSVLANALDRLAMQIGRIKGDLARSIKIPYLEAGGDAATKIPSAAADRALQALRFDVDGNIMVGAELGAPVVVSVFGQTLIDDGGPAAARATLGIAGTEPTAGAADTVLTTTGAAAVWQKATNANLATVPTQTLKGRTTAGIGAPEDLNPEQAAAILPAFVGDAGAGGVKGSVPAPAAGDAALGLVLGAGGTWVKRAVAIFWAKIVNSAVIPIAAATAATADRIHEIAGVAGDYDITLPVAPPVGTVVGLHVLPFASANRQYRLDAGVGVVVCGRARFLVLLHTNFALLRWDGTRWHPLALSLDTPWIDTGAAVITGSTTNPTKGATVTNDRLWYRRVGGSADFRWDYRQTSAGTAGTGTYGLTTPFTIDIALLSVGAFPVVAAQFFNVAGTGRANADHCTVTVTGPFRVCMSTGATPWGSASQPFSLAAPFFAMQFTVPIVSW